MPANKKFLRWLVLPLMVIGWIFGLIALNRWLDSLKNGQLEEDIIPGPDPVSPLQGLSEEEVAVKIEAIDLEDYSRRERRRFTIRAIRSNLFTIFNIDLIAIGILMYALGSPLSTLGTAAVLIIAVALNTIQEVYTKRQLDQILEKIRPKAAVIRDGRIKSVDPNYIVEGDLIIVRPGDQILVNGQMSSSDSIVVEEIEVEHQVKRIKKTCPDSLRVNSYCVEGHGVYQATEYGIYSQQEAQAGKIQLLKKDPTPIKRLIAIVMWSLFAMVVIISLLLVLDSFFIQADIVSDDYRDAFGIIFGVAPTSLFLILIVQYAMGTLRIANVGALVYQSESIESLSNVSTVCFSQESLFSGLRVALEPLPTPSGYEQLSERLIRQMLGDVLHSTPSTSPEMRTLDESFPGSFHWPLNTAPYFSTLGWYAATFNESDLRGTYVIGQPQILEPFLVKDEIDFGNEQPEGENESQSRTRQLLSRVRRLRETRSKKQIQQPGQESTTTPISQPQAEGDHAENTKTHLRERVRNTVLDLLKPIEDKQIAEIPVQEWLGKTTLLFAYLPEPVPIFNRQNQPRLPQELIPLANLDVSNTIRPELKQVITNLASQEIKIKILASDAPEIVFAQAQALGIQTDMLSKITGGELEGLEAQDRSSKVAETQIFSKLSPAQKALIVKTLHQQGEYVAMVGNDASDVPAMQQANLRIALKSGKQAAVILTDIVLLEDSLQALSSVLTAGQRLVNGVLDTFKLYLSQVFAQLLLILYMIFFSLDQFPYHPTQAGVINAFTIVIPNILLAVWSAGGKLTESEIRRRLLIFILPIAITLSLLIWAVFEIFLSMPPPVDFPPEELIKPLKITNPQIFLAQIAVVFAMLFAGWLRVLFLQPPSPFWVGGAPLRGDRRVYGLVFVSIAVYILVLIFPWLPLQEWLRITWLPSLRDYLIVAGAVAIWAILLLGIWRSGILPKIFTRIGRNDLGSHKNHRPKKI